MNVNSIKNNQKIWNSIISTLEKKDESSVNKILNKLTLKNELNNEIIYMILKSKLYKYFEKDVTKLINLMSINNKITHKVLFKFFKKSEIKTALDYYLNKTNKNSKNLIKKEYISLYIEENPKIKVNILIFILKNYKLHTEELDILYKKNYRDLFNKYELEFNDFNNNKLFLYYKDFNPIKFFKLKKNLFFYFLKQPKLNEILKEKFYKLYIIFFKLFILYYISNNKTTLYKKYFYNIKFLDYHFIEQTLVEEIKNFIMILYDKTENNFNILKIETIEKKIGIYYYLNIEYQEENDYEYFLENNFKEIEFYHEITNEMYLNLLDNYVYEETIDNIVFTIKAIIKINKFNEYDKLLEILTQEYFYDENTDLIKIYFRYVFIKLFNNFPFEIDRIKDEEEKRRLLFNIKRLYEKLYYKDIHVHNLKYIIPEIPKTNKEEYEDKLFNFLYKNDLMEIFFKSDLIEKFDFNYLKNIIIKYIDNINTHKSYLNEDEKIYLKENILKLLLSNKGLNKAYHLKFYHNHQNINIKKHLLMNENLSIIVLYKSILNVKEIFYLIDNKRLYNMNN